MGSSPAGSCDLTVSSSYHFLWRREPISKEEEEEEEETSGESSGLGYAADATSKVSGPPIKPRSVLANVYYTMSRTVATTRCDGNFD